MQETFLFFLTAKINLLILEPLISNIFILQPTKDILTDTTSLICSTNQTRSSIKGSCSLQNDRSFHLRHERFRQEFWRRAAEAKRFNNIYNSNERYLCIHSKAIRKSRDSREKNLNW